MPRGISRYDEAQLQGRLWTPALLGNAVQVWIAPRDPATVILDSSSRVSSVRDLSLYRANFDQSTPASRPTYVRSGLLPGVANEGSDFNWMIRDTGSAVTLNDFTLFMNVMWTANASVAGFPAFVSAQATSTADDFRTGFTFDRGVSGGTLNPFSVMGAASPKDISNTDLLADSISYNVPTIFSVRVRDAAGRQSISVNGYEQGLSFVPAAPTATIGLRVMRLFGRFYLGAIQTYERGIIAEMFLVGRTMSPSEIQLGEAYLAWAVGSPQQLVPSHPFRNRPPLIGD